MREVDLPKAKTEGEKNIKIYYTNKSSYKYFFHPFLTPRKDCKEGAWGQGFRFPSPKTPNLKTTKVGTPRSPLAPLRFAKIVCENFNIFAGHFCKFFAKLSFKKAAALRTCFCLWGLFM